MVLVAVTSHWWMEPTAAGATRGYDRLAGIGLLVVFTGLTWQYKKANDLSL